MQKTISKNIFMLFIIINLNCLLLNGQDIVVGNIRSATQSFDFNVKAHDIFIPGQKFFVASDDAIPDNIFAVSSNTYASPGFKPLALKQVTLNNVTLSNNPLCGAAISHISMTGYSPIVVKKNEPVIYVINDYIASAINVFSTDEILDSSGRKSSKILSVTSDLPKQLESPESLYNNSMIFAAVSKNNSAEEKSDKFIPKEPEFDGIALAQLRVLKEVYDGREITYFKFVQFDAQTGLEGNKAAPIKVDSDIVKIGSNLSKIGNIADIYFDNILNRLYIALDLQSGDKESDGAKAIVVAGLAGNKLIFHSIAPNSALKTSKVINTNGASSRIVINKIRTMFTKTYLNYLIVVKNNQKVFAMPLVNNTGSEFHGCLADINAKSINVFTSGLPHRFLTRTFLKEARNPEELYSDSDLKAQVGGGASLPGDITDIDIAGDTVFVSVMADGNDKDNSKKSGIFQSQAVFDDSGKIIGWTKWSRAALEPINTVGFAFNAVTSNFWNIPANNLNQLPNKLDDKLNTNNVFKTKWTRGQTDLEKLISQQFLKDLNGVQGLSDFDYNTAGFNKTIGNRISFLVLTGFNKVGIIESARDIGNIFTPTLNSNLNNNFNNIILSKDGIIPNLEDITDTSSLFISGGTLNEIGNITSSAILNDGRYAWLAVAGTGGIAILCNKDGSGWPIYPGLSKGLSELSGLSFKLIKEYKTVVKIIAVQNRLYVLTDKKLDKLEISPDFISKYSACDKDAKINTLANVFESNLPDVEIFSDMAIIEPVALLATSNGFFRSGDNIDITKVTSDNYADWTLINMPEAAGTVSGNGPATRIFTMPQFRVLEDKFKNIYLLNAYSGYEQAQIYRFALSLKDNQVTSNSVKLFQDIFIKDRTTFFVNLEDYRNYIYSDGATIAASRSSFMDESPKLFLLPYNLKSSQRFGARSLISLDLDLHNFRSIGQLSKTYSGAFIVYGDFGIRLNQ